MRLLATILAALLLVGAAHAWDQRLYVPGAQNFGGGGREMVLNNNTGGAPPPPPVCSNSADFSDPCNSQYAGAL